MALQSKVPPLLRRRTAPVRHTGADHRPVEGDVLDRLRAANIPQVTFTGGEPTLREDLVELVEAAQWFVTRLNTNGRLLTPALCQKLYEASLDSVQVTLYSHDKDIPQRPGGCRRL